MSDLILKNKVAIITGSSRGIGKATALEFVARGAFVVINGRNGNRLEKAEQEIRLLTDKVLAIQCDVSVPEQAQEMVNRCIEQFGRLDILVNNVGVSMRGNFGEVCPAVFDEVFKTNVMGKVNPTLYSLPHLKESKGSVVFVSSLAGIRGLPDLSAYCASKMALRAIAESIRIEEANSDIHVGLILVGMTEIESGKTTIMADGSLEELQSRSNSNVQTTEQVAKAILNTIARRKFIITLTRVGKLTAFLQSLAPTLVEKLVIIFSRKMKARSH